MKKRIVILGAGFAGIYTFKYLHRKFHANDSVELVLVDKNNYFLFTPLLHEVATGNVAPDHITHPVRQSLGCCLSEFHEAEVVGVKTKEQVVETSNGKIAYDYLVVALGGKTNYFGNKTLAKNTFGLKTLQDAFALKNQIIDTLEQAHQTQDTDERERLLRYVVVGGGPTGVELAAEISDYIYGTFAHYFPKSLIDQVDIQLLQAVDVLLPGFPVFLQTEAEKVLTREKVTVRKSCLVESIQDSKIKVKEGEDIVAATTVWAAGVAATPIKFDVKVEDNRGMLVVESDFQIKGHKNIFSLGDVAYFEQDGVPLAPLAQVAVAQAKALANNIYADIKGQPRKPFRYVSKGLLVSLGKFRAAGKIGPFKLRGPFMWWFWRTVYWAKLLTWKQRIKVALDWTVALFTKRDISKLS